MPLTGEVTPGETSAPQELRFGNDWLLVFLDETGHEAFSGNQPYYAVGGCALLGLHHAWIKQRWREVRRLINGSADAPLHAAELRPTPESLSLPLMAFTFKNLSDEQRRAIVQGVKDAKTAAPNGAANPDFYANVGVQVPIAVDLRALPDEVTAKIPQTRAYRYTMVGDKVLLVEPANRTVVAVIKE
jgi:hypothetical protein